MYLFRTVDNITKCNVQGSSTSGSVETYYEDIYSLPGTLPTDIADQTPGVNQNVFPNPAQEYIFIPLTLTGNGNTTLRIFKLNGQLMDSKEIIGNVPSLRINVQSYPAGEYFYKYNNLSGKFVVTK